MQTLKLKISNTIDVSQYCEQYSYMFRKMYANAELMDDKGFERELREQFGMDSWMYQCCKVDVKMKKEQNATQWKKKLQKIESVEYDLQNDTYEGRKGRRHKFNLLHKLATLKRTGLDEITFGTKALLRRISYLSNLLDEASMQERSDLQSEYRRKRIMPIHIIGEAPQGSNRKMDFDLANRKLTYKPKNGVKIPIEFHCGRNQMRILTKLQEQVGEQAISIYLNNEHVCISYDEQKLSNYAFNKHEYFAELKAISKEDKQLRKECYKRWAKEQEERMFADKNETRYIGFDLNPEYIGVSILERLSDGKYRIIHKEVISFAGLNTRLGLSSMDPEQVYQNNKRTYELCEVWSRIFKIAEYYRVAHCIQEDLEFKDDNMAVAKQANRLTKNLWHRTQTEELIQKYCSIKGIKLDKVNACYSSFIGNIQHTYFDPLNAAMEVTRRGIYKYLKGSGGFYPPLESSDLNTMSQLGLDVSGNTISTWAQAFNTFKAVGLRYRRELKNSTEHNLKSHRSRVVIYNFI